MTFVLAPLAGFTDAPFRRLCHECGADVVYTEMVSAAALAHGHGPTHQLLEVMPGEGDVVCQIFGATESDVAHAAREIEQLPCTAGGPRFSALNLNAGCPMTKVTRCGAGAELVKDPAKVGRLLRAMAENTSLPVTVKTRLGPHPQATTIFEILDAATDAGAKGITVHARYTSQMHGGDVHLDVLSDVVSRARIPVTGNGSVVDSASCARMAATGVAAIMIGRAALSHPALFATLKAQEDSPIGPSPLSQHLAYLIDFHSQWMKHFPHQRVLSLDGYVALKMRTHLFRYFNGRPGAAALRARLNQVRSLAEIRELLATLDVV